MAYRILHCLSSMNRGGAETFVMNLYREIDKSKYSFDFLLNTSDGAYVDEIKKLGGNIYIYPHRNNGYIKYCISLYSFFRKEGKKYDAVHMHTSSLSAIEVLLFAKLFHVKTRIIHSHSTVQEGRIHQILHRLNRPLVSIAANKYLACSKVAGDWLFAHTPAINKYIIVNNGIDVKRFSYNSEYRNEIRNLYGIESNDTIIGHVGRFDEVKNHSFLIDVFLEYHKINPHSTLVLVGDGQLKKACVEKCENLGLSNYVVFAGVQQEVYKYLSAYDYFLFPSLYEGLPVSLVEAQASGLTVICSDQVSYESKLTDSVFFYPLSLEPRIWAENISRLSLNNRADYGQIIENKGYSVKRTIQVLEENVYV